MKGIIALDIDGTITNDRHDISKDVVNFLSSLAKNGWQFIFVTGRPFQWGYSALCQIPFPYYFAVQNGAIILAMPERRVVDKKYLKKNILPALDEICQREETGFVVYAGYEFEDRCFYKPSYFRPHLLEYIHHRAKMLKENWVSLTSYDTLPISEFASIKCFGLEDSAGRISLGIESSLGLHGPSIRDAFDASYYVVQATHPGINKGSAVRSFQNLIGCEGPIIAAGDDNNDRSMLEIAEIKIVMATAPKEMHLLADIIAPSAAEHGIISGLTQAIDQI